MKHPTTTEIEYHVEADHIHLSCVAEGRTLKVRARQTTAAGGETIYCGVWYGVK